MGPHLQRISFNRSMWSPESRILTIWNPKGLITLQETLVDGVRLMITAAELVLP